MGTTIENIRLERNTLKWQASGALSDDNFDDAYSWCYYYTVVAWNPSNINVTVDHKDGSCDPNDSSDPSANFFGAENHGTTTALYLFPVFFKILISRPVILLPYSRADSHSGGVVVLRTTIWFK